MASLFKALSICFLAKSSTASAALLTFKKLAKGPPKELINLAAFPANPAISLLTSNICFATLNSLSKLGTIPKSIACLTLPSNATSLL